jgi:hypothetical protein
MSDTPQTTTFRSIAIEPPPRKKRLLVAGRGQTRFGILDEVGVWRKQHGQPMGTSPTHWMDVPALGANKEIANAK